MTLKDCMEIGNSCGFSTIEKCYDNVVHLSTMMFKYKDVIYYYPNLFCQMFDTDKNTLVEDGWKIKDET